MTFKLDERYPGRANPPSAGYPRGSFKNRTSATEADGTYLEEDWKNDERGFFDAICINGNVVPNGQVDTGQNSQIYDALMGIVSKMISVNTETLYGRAFGGENEISVTLPRSVELKDGTFIFVRAQYKNSISAPTISVNGMTAKAIVKGNNLPLSIGDIAGAGYIMHLAFDQNFDRWILLNPATGVIVPQSIPVGTLAYMGRNDEIDGWLKVDNREHQRSQYPKLVAECPQFILSGSSPETFKLIDLRGYFLRTLDNGKGVDDGRAFGSMQGDAIRNITGKFGTPTSEGGNYGDGAFSHKVSYGGRAAGANGNALRFDFDASRVVPTSNENRPKNYALPLYIKY